MTDIPDTTPPAIRAQVNQLLDMLKRQAGVLRLPPHKILSAEDLEQRLELIRRQATRRSV